MTTYNLQIVTDALKEISSQFIMTKGLEIKEVAYDSPEERYIVTISDGSRHFLDKELVNKYIESFGDKGSIEIAGALLHSIDLEESARSAIGEKRGDEDFWDGDINDVTNYLEKKKKIDDKGGEEMG